MFYYGYDPTYILIIVGFLITLVAQIFVKVNYNKYKKVNIKTNLDGYEVARKMLDMNGLNNIDIVETEGELTDHYDPTRKVIRLSKDIYHGKSIAGCSVASHECGHAIQDKEGYLFLKFRNSIVPLVNFSSKIGYIAIAIGLIFGFLNLAWIGVFLELFILLFQLVTLPVEFNASKRGKEFLIKQNIVDSKEQKGCKKVLNAAAFTYVAGLLSTLLEILRLVLIISNRDDK